MYPLPLRAEHTPMISRVHRATLFALYQLCILVGIAALPIALLTRQVGLTLPVHRLLVRVESAYENTASQS
ncbi:hypothetical protein [Halovivax sp.]|uniref:hypothetical protein n=1 Tax=Halovivax sp. TaxID=1935978 RepID=UPI0025C6DC0E|nr:hypothetical protein [Halovivax sp.]